MPREIGVVVIHGMGAQQRRFSDDLQAAVSKELGEDRTRFVWQEVFWADVLEQRETDLLHAMRGATDAHGERVPLGWQSLREFVMHNFGDALAYHRDRKAGSVYAAVHARISLALNALREALDDPSAPIVVMAHSLGVQMMSDYIWDRQHGRSSADDPHCGIPNLAAIISFGCNVPLFALEFEVAVPVYLPGEAIAATALKAAARWLNFLDRDDVLGWPMRPLYERHLPVLDVRQRDTVQRIEDHEVNVGGLGSSWNPVSHGEYWSDRDFTAQVGKYLRTLVKAADQ